MIPLSTRQSLMAALEHDRVIEPAKNIYRKEIHERFWPTITIFHANTNLLPMNLPEFQSAAQIIKIRPERILYQNFKNRH